MIADGASIGSIRKKANLDSIPSRKLRLLHGYETYNQNKMNLTN